MNKPIAVLVADIHYNLSTLALADAAMRMAVAKANDLEVPLIVCGDLHDTKANLRGECVNAMIKTFKLCVTPPYILVGNHDKINEKSTEHSLNFLSSYCHIIDTLYSSTKYNGIYLLPYQFDNVNFAAFIKTIPKDSTLIVHQGIEGSHHGDYIQDKSAIHPEDVAGMRVISGHYHRRQTIRLPDGGVWDYIGNPYTLNYVEASDPPKGFQILMEDGSLEFVPTNLRKHVVWNEFIGHQSNQPSVSEGDLLWIKMHGTKEQLSKVTKTSIPLKMPFRLDLIPTDTKTSIDPRLNLSQGPLLDSLIDSLTETSPEQKARLKQTWKSLCE